MTLCIPKNHNKKNLIFFVQIYKNENENLKKYCIKAEYEKTTDQLISHGKKDGK